MGVQSRGDSNVFYPVPFFLGIVLVKTCFEYSNRNGLGWDFQKRMWYKEGYI